jgi:hypothetical protein
VESIELDYDRMASLIQDVQSSDGGASNPSPQGAGDVIEPSAPKGSGSGSIRRISTAGSEQVNDSQ